MSETWGPRAKPCQDDDWPKKTPPMKRGEQILTVIMVTVVIMAALVWLTAKWGW